MYLEVSCVGCLESDEDSRFKVFFSDIFLSLKT